MPVMDGYQASEAIRALTREDAGERFPSLALTANAFATDIGKATPRRHERPCGKT
ncbi:MAG: hypothetical protein ACLTW9_18075 [Enterocloster sp.]